MDKFVYNKNELKFDARKFSFWRVLWVCFKYLLLSVFLSLIYYVLFALVFNTDQEKRLSTENKYIAGEYNKMTSRVNLLDNVIKNLQLRDNKIYEDIFNADPPDFFSSYFGDTLSLDIEKMNNDEEVDIIWESYVKGIQLSQEVNRTNNWINNITNKITEENFGPTTIPSIIPIKEFSIAQTGASVGNKINPFYKTIRMHTGIDLLAPVGTEVRSTAEGVVIIASRSVKGEGNKIVIQHENGICTLYSHLSDILVRKDQKIKQGTIIGRVGITGTTFAPHLHYEVLKDNIPMDPINYFFAELLPLTYQEMMVIALNTGQSLD